MRHLLGWMVDLVVNGKNYKQWCLSTGWHLHFACLLILEKFKGKISHVWPQFCRLTGWHLISDKKIRLCERRYWLNGWLVISDKKIKLCVCHFIGWMVDLVVKVKNLKQWCLSTDWHIHSICLRIWCVRFFWLTGWLWILEKDKRKISHVWPPYCWLNCWLVISDQRIKLCVRHFFGWMVDFSC